MNLDTFCVDVVSDFTPLGGNRPDCAVVMAAAVSLAEDQQQPSSLSLVLPPDVLDTAMAATCATVIIRSASDVVPPPHGCDRGDRLSCRLEIGCDEALDGFRNTRSDDYFEMENMPWRNFDTVCLQISLPDFITSWPIELLDNCYSLVTIDLRSTKLQTVGEFFLYGCEALREVYLPSTLHTVGRSFLSRNSNLVSIDLRNTKLQTVGDCCLFACTSLTEVFLPDTLITVGHFFLHECGKLLFIDLRHTKLQSLGDQFLWDCTSLTEVFLPDTLMAVGHFFLHNCGKLSSIDLSNTRLQSVGNTFLYGCEALTEVRLPDTLHTVGESFLGGCESLPQERLVSITRSIEERQR